MKLTSEQVEAIMGFWFPPGLDDPDAIGPAMGFWYTPNPELDREVKERFGDLVAQALDAPVDLNGLSGHDVLARILLLDQFTRNIYRGDAKAFSGDEKGLAYCREGIALGLDKECTYPERAFFYMPFQHTEDVQLQQESVRVFGAFADDIPEEWKVWADGSVDYAKQHQELIDRFGRFPHRNLALGRDSTPEEIAFLKDGGVSFGQ